MINIARERKASAYVGEGNNRWCAVHRFDAAKLYRLAFEKLAQGNNVQKISFYHGVAEEAVPFRTIAEVIGRRLRVPLKSLSPAEAQTYFTWFAHFAASNLSASSRETQAELGWKPAEIGFLADIDRPAYFETE